MELPGFEIQREIGRGGMARVYLAVQKKFGRQVVLKVVSPDFARDPQFRRRFLQESRINAQLSHPNIVQVYDVGAHNDLLYLVLEYIKGGDLIRRMERGIHVQDLIRVVRDIGRALDYAHSQGFIHRDIKPENILFREDGSAVLSDFGIARVADENPSITRAGTVVGTPQYMSPEQAAGRKLDARSDLYSLGVVFYRMLTGDVPYKADSAVSIGIKHLQEPVPRLPNYLAPFQPVIDRCLAKKPDHRYQSGGELTEALEAVRTDTPLPNATIRQEAVSTEEIRAVGSSLLTTVRDPARVDRSQRLRRRQVLRQVVLVSLLVALIGGASLVAVKEPQWVMRLLAVAGIVDDPTVQEAWNNARSLRQDPNQSLAAIVSAYRRVLTLQPDHPGALDALNGLAAQWRSDIERALASGDLAQAETKLAESSQSFPDDPSLTALAEQLTDRRHAQNLLASTQALLRSHGLSDIPSATAAIQAYQEVLRLAPGNATARAELDTLAQHYATLAANAADEGNVDGAISFLDRATAANNALPQLALVREKIQQANTLRTAISDLLQQASRYREAGALINPPGENAAELYHRVLATDPDNVIATQGLNEVVSQLLSEATQRLTAGDLDGVRALLDRASAVGLAPDAVNQIKTRLDAEANRRSAVAANLARARELLSQGFVTEPPTGNAVSILREVERIDPENAEARVLLQQCAERLAGVAEDAYAVGMTEDARHYLELALTVTPGVARWRELREQWEKDDPTL
ncbi:MAG: protein kinase [Pseudomonadales bacterium]